MTGGEHREGGTRGHDRTGGAAIRRAARDPVLVDVALAIAERRFADAEPSLRAHLRDDPFDVAAIRMMAELATRIGRLGDADRLLDRALELAPDFHAARELRARNRQRQNRPESALADVVHLRAEDDRDPSLAMLHAALLVALGDQAAAEPIYHAILTAHPAYPAGWMSLGHVLKTLGRRDEGIAAYHRALQQQPTLGEAWWSLANLKTVTFDATDRAAMEQALADAPTSEDRYHLLFALAKAHEDLGDIAGAAPLYQQANACRRAEQPHDAARLHGTMVSNARMVRHDAARILAGGGCPAADPIFIVGLPRAGSTLVEQILASHSAIEGTAELPTMLAIAHDVEAAGKTAADLTAEERLRLGTRYIEQTRCYRREGKPFFIDKMPNNVRHVALIRAILPQARIVDARRHPLDCGLSIWRQHFARGQSFAYDLTDIGRYYRNYVAFMSVVDAAMPGAVHRVIHESLVADTETEVRALLDHVGVPFEAACLTFWRNPRPVRTPSSEQVRRAINADGIGGASRFGAALAPLRAALGPVLDAYPATPPLPALWPTDKI